MTQLLIYENLVPVNRDQHGGFYFETGNSFEYCRTTNSVPVLAGEFPILAQEYAIVFTETTDGTVPVAIVGARDHENAFVTKDGGWSGRYVPAFIRRYPFVFGADPSNAETLTLMIDDTFAGLNKKGKGEPLFKPDGGAAPFLDNVLKFLSDYQAGFARTLSFCKKLDDLALLEPSTARLALPEDAEHQMSGFKTVNRQKLKDLAADKVADLFSTDELELIYLHFFSLPNFSRIQEKISPLVTRKKVKV